MKSAAENIKLSLIECRKILNTDGLCYTDEEVLKIRDWLYHMADIAIDAIDKNTNTVIETADTTTSKTKNKGKP
jgi:hypothetical protein